MATRRFHGEYTRAPMGAGMRLYWAVVTVVALALLGATVHVATPRDAMDFAEATIAP
jgi:hypothetical protein